MKYLGSAISRLMLGFCLFLPGTYALAVMQLIEESVEAVELEVRVDKNLRGYAVGAVCVQCKKHRFIVTPDTRYIRNNRMVDPSDAFSFSGKPGTIVYDIETKNVTKILQLE